MSEVELVCAELGPALEELRESGHRLDLIYPADDPHTAILSKGGQSVRLTSHPGARPPSDELPPFRAGFVLSRSASRFGQGRAGMGYRDLVPGRLGGRYIASHITIAQAGPVSDWVHYHQLRFQMICVRCGWVRAVYEDQGDPFVMQAGDMVLQPPLIRHRVLESSAGAQVVEIGCPAVHSTFADHQLDLPNRRIDRARDFSGQRFLRHRASAVPWAPFAGGEAQQSAMAGATGGLAEARTIRAPDGHLAFARHSGELVFGFVLAGSAILSRHADEQLGPADSFVVPPDEQWQLTDASPDFRLLHVTTSRIGKS